VRAAVQLPLAHCGIAVAMRKTRRGSPR